MDNKKSIIWVSIVGVIGMLFGLFYAFFGLRGLPVYEKIVPNNVYTAWSNGLYGSVFIGFSVLLFTVGRYAFKNNDKVLMKALLYGIYSWLIVEALFSLFYRVYLNVGVDIVLGIFLGLPLIKNLRSK
jgi:hypothetical protein